MDYRELLIKYLAHVACIEGTDFLGYRWRDRSPVVFTDDEWQKLTELPSLLDN